ncbi:Two-component system response regulator [Planctomycetales bacterium 10988]|nr:Two-component system response regulator [Planctomycetales bacterium 10988]
MTIRLLVADDHEVVRSGLESLTAGTDIEVVGKAESGKEVIQLAQELNPDLVILDIRMPQSDGLTALEQLRQLFPDLPILMLSTYENPTYAGRALALGANGYMLKGSSRDKLVEAIREVAAGGDAWDSQEVRRATTTVPNEKAAAELESPLTQRESQVLRQLALGLSNKEIARTLHISVETVKEHVHNILEKLGVNGRTQAAVWAVRNGLL